LRDDGTGEVQDAFRIEPRTSYVASVWNPEKKRRRPRAGLGSVGIRLEAEAETADTAEVFNDLNVDREKHPMRPLFAGAWE